MIAIPLNAIDDRNTVLYASALATCYALIPVASMSVVMPGTAAKAAGVPTVMAFKKAATDVAGRPAVIKNGGTWAGIVCLRRLERMKE